MEKASLRQLLRSAIDGFRYKPAATDPWVTEHYSKFMDSDCIQRRMHKARTYALIELYRKLVDSKLVLVKRYDCETSEDLDTLGRLKKYLFDRILTKRTLLVLIALACSFFMIVTMQMGSCMEFRRDKLLNKTSRIIEVESDSIADREGSCVKRSELSAEAMHYQDKLDGINKNIEHFGVAPQFPTLATLLHSLTSFACLVYFALTTLILYLKPLQVDHMIYLLDPDEELSRLSRSINNIIDRFEAISDSDGLTTDDLSNEEVFNYYCGDLKACTSGGRTDYAVARYKGSVEFSFLIRTLRDFDLIRPLPFSRHWYINLISLSTMLMMSVCFLTLIGPIIAGVGVTSYELYARAITRLDLYRCQLLWPNDSVLLIGQMVALPELTSEAHEVLYINALQTYSRAIQEDRYLFVNSDIMYLVLKVEPLYFFNMKSALFLSEMFIIIVILSSATAVYGVTYIAGLVSRLAWLKQLDTQVKYCIDLTTGKVGPEHMIATINKLLPENTRNLTRRRTFGLAHFITIAGINIELFRNEYRKIYSTLNFLTLQTCVFCGFGAVFNYVDMAYAITRTQLLGFYSLFWILLSLNIIVGYSSYYTFQFDKLMLSISELVSMFPARERTCDPDLMEQEQRRSVILMAIGLLKQNLIHAQDVRRIYAPSVFLVYLDFEKFLSLNGLALAFSMLLYNSESFSELLRFSTLFCS